jgi:hypothetical protein
MDSEPYIDPLASVFPPTDNPRFSNLNWPVWDNNVFDRDVQALEDGRKLAFIAGTTYVRYAVSLERPKILSELLDKVTLNFLGRWGITGFIIGQDKALYLTQDDRNLLACYRSGVLFAINTLREADVPDNVNKDNVKELIDALESYAHVHFVTMAELGPAIMEAAELENVLTEVSMLELAQESEQHGDSEDEAGTKPKNVVETESENMGGSTRRGKRAKSKKAKKAKKQVARDGKHLESQVKG